MRRYVTPRRLQALGVLFVCIVVGVVAYTQQLVIPIFLGLLTWGKAWIKTLTPKLGLLLVKNSLVIQLRRMLVKASAHVFVKSHKPWRRFLTRMRLEALALVKNAFAGYLQMPLWLRTGAAIAVLLLTAGSSFAVFALLIIPQPVLDWLRKQIVTLLNKLGVTQFFSAVWKFLIPTTIRHRWHMYVKWSLGRHQVRAAQRLHESVVKTPKRGEHSEGSGS